MILVDTALWIDHLRRPVPRLVEALTTGYVGTHPFIVGELGLGRWRGRTTMLTLMGRLPHLPIARETEVWHLLEAQDLTGVGIGWIDLHLLCAARVARWSLWTTDTALARVVRRLDME